MINMNDHSTLEIDKLIIHEVMRPETSQSKKQPNFSEIESSLTDEIRGLIRNKVVSTIGSKRSYTVQFDPDTTSPIPNLVNKLIEDQTQFVELSKEVALHLNNIQDMRNPSGFVMVLLGRITSKKVVGIFKIELEEGARVEQSLRDGKLTFDIISLKDIILTKNTRFYKISLFYQDGIEAHGYAGKVCDNQISVRGEVANFFLTKFLGCSLTRDPKKQTKDFFEASERFILEHVKDPSIKYEYKLHLLSYLSNRTNTIDPRMFARNYLNTEDRRPFIDYLNEHGVGSNVIIRDTSNIETKIKQMRLVFENNIEITGSQRDFKDNVKIQTLEEGYVRAEVVSKVKRL